MKVTFEIDDNDLKMAIEAMTLPNNLSFLMAITACKEALEQPSVAELNDEYLRDTYVQGLSQPAQEPVALIFPENRWYIPSPLDKDEKQIEFNRGFAQGFNDCILHVKLHNQKPLYTHPAPSWQGLSDDDFKDTSWFTDEFIEGANWAQNKLKEKNNE